MKKEWLTWDLRVEHEEEKVLEKILIDIRDLRIHMYQMRRFSAATQVMTGLSFKELAVKELATIERIASKVAELKSLVKKLRA